jgi:hypothetical protein
MKKYEGPAKPIPTHREPMSDRAELIWYAVLAALLGIIIYLE